MRQKDISRTIATIFRYYPTILAKEPIWNYNDHLLLERRFVFSTDRAYFSDPFLFLHVRRSFLRDRFLVFKMVKDISVKKNLLKMMPFVLQWFGIGVPNHSSYHALAIRNLSRHGRIVTKKDEEWLEIVSLFKEKQDRLFDLLTHNQISNGKLLLQHTALAAPCPCCAVELDTVVRDLSTIVCDACEASLVWVQNPEGSELIVLDTVPVDIEKEFLYLEIIPEV